MQSSFDEMAHWYKRFFRLVAILPFENEDFNYPLTQILLVYCLLASLIYCSMFLCYMIIYPSIEATCETIVVAGTTLRYYAMLLNRHEFVKLLEESRVIWEDFDEDGRETVRQFERKIRRLFKFLLVSFFSTNFSYCVAAALATMTAPNINGTHAHFLPFKWYSNEAPNHWPGYKIIFVTQVMVTNNACIYGPSVDSAAPFLIMIGAGYFRALQNRILRIPDIEDESVADLELVTCCRLHQRILNFCTGIDKLTRNLFFMNLICTVYNISLTGIKLAGTDPDRYKFLPLNLINVSQLFITQWAPDNLIDESLAISTAAFSVSVAWMRRRLGKILILIIARSQRPVHMTAAGVVYLSLEKFGSMLTSAFSFFTVLRNFSN